VLRLRASSRLKKDFIQRAAELEGIAPQVKNCAPGRARARTREEEEPRLGRRTGAVMSETSKALASWH